MASPEESPETRDPSDAPVVSMERLLSQDVLGLIIASGRGAGRRDDEGGARAVEATLDALDAMGVTARVVVVGADDVEVGRRVEARARRVVHKLDRGSAHAVRAAHQALARHGGRVLVMGVEGVAPEALRRVVAATDDPGVAVAALEGGGGGVYCFRVAPLITALVNMQPSAGRGTYDLEALPGWLADAGWTVRRLEAGADARREAA